MNVIHSFSRQESVEALNPLRRCTLCGCTGTACVLAGPIARVPDEQNRLGLYNSVWAAYLFPDKCTNTESS